MTTYILRPEVISEIKSDNDLFCAVAKIVDVAPTTMPHLWKRNDIRLTTKSVLGAICQHLNQKNGTNLSEDDLLEIQEDTDRVERTVNLQQVSEKL